MSSQNQLRALRTQHCLTQEELADASGISIRTIQRIEKGLSTGSAHTLKALAKTLNVDPLSLAGIKENAADEDQDDIIKVQLLNFSILSVLLVPFGNLILPTFIFLLNKTNNKVASIGKRIIRFQLLTTVVLFYLTVLIFMNIGRGSGAIPTPVVICYVMYVLVSAFIVFRTFVHLQREQKAPNFFPNFI